MSNLVPDPADYEELRAGSALITELGADWLRLAGPDRSRFANGLVSCDLRSLTPGAGAYGFFNDGKGKILSEAAFLASTDELWIELPAGLGPVIAGHMRKYVVADRVEIEETGWSSLRAAGPRMPELLRSVVQVGNVTGSWRGETAVVDGAAVVVRGDLRLGVPAVVVAGPGPALANVGNALSAAGLRSVGLPAVAAVRIEEGIPWFANDFASSTYFPQETGIEDWAVSYEKGCYLGQEVIARIHFRGRVNRLLRGLVFALDSEPRPGADLALNGEIVGAAGSVAHSPRHKCPIGLAIVHRKAEAGAQLATPFGPCRLVELPFEETGQAAPESPAR